MYKGYISEIKGDIVYLDLLESTEDLCLTEHNKDEMHAKYGDVITLGRVFLLDSEGNFWWRMDLWTENDITKLLFRAEEFTKFLEKD